MPYLSPPPAWMPGKEALDHIRETDECSASDAIKQLRSAISDGRANTRLPDPKEPRRSAIFPPWNIKSIAYDPGLATPRLSPGARQIPNREDWRKAKIFANGAVSFFGGRYRPYAFEVRRVDVLQIWPAKLVSPQSSPVRKRMQPISLGIRKAIAELWPTSNPPLTSKDRNNKIFEWLKSNGYSVPKGSGLARAVQRAMKSRA